MGVDRFHQLLLTFGLGANRFDEGLVSFAAIGSPSSFDNLQTATIVRTVGGLSFGSTLCGTFSHVRLLAPFCA
jgi:hypothetical protein